MKEYEEKITVYNCEDEVHKQKPRPNTFQPKYLNLESYQKPYYFIFGVANIESQFVLNAPVTVLMHNPYIVLIHTPYSISLEDRSLRQDHRIIFPLNTWNSGSIPGSGRSRGEGNSNPLQYSCLENPMDQGAWQATVHGIAKSWT